MDCDTARSLLRELSTLLPREQWFGLWSKSMVSDSESSESNIHEKKDDNVKIVLTLFLPGLL